MANFVVTFWFLGYAIPFLLIAAMPGWRSAAIMAALLGVLIVWQNRELQIAIEDPGGDFGEAMAELAMHFAAIGAIGGAITRTVTLIVRRSRSRWIVPPLTVLGFLAGPAILYGQY